MFGQRFTHVTFTQQSCEKSNKRDDIVALINNSAVFQDASHRYWRGFLSFDIVVSG